MLVDEIEDVYLELIIVRVAKAQVSTLQEALARLASILDRLRGLLNPVPLYLPRA